MSTSYENYEDIYDTLCLEYALGNITLEEAERVNEKAFEKYVSEKNQLDYYDDNHNKNYKQDRLLASGQDVSQAAGSLGRYLTNPDTVGGKATKALAKPAAKFGDGLEKGGRAVGKAVMKKPVSKEPKLVEAYNRKLNIWGKTVKIGGYLGSYVALYGLTPLCLAVPKTATAKLAAASASSAVSPATHIGMEVNAVQDKDIQSAVRWLAAKTAPLRNKFKALCDKYEGQKITPQLKGEFDKINAQGLAAVKQASAGLMHESVDENTDIVALFKEAGSLFDDKGDAVIYAINHADYTNPDTVQVIDEYIENYM